MKNMKKKYIVSIIAAVIVFVMAAGIYLLYPRPLEISVAKITLTEEDTIAFILEVRNSNIFKYYDSCGCMFGEKSDIITDDHAKPVFHYYIDNDAINPAGIFGKINGEDYITHCSYNFHIRKGLSKALSEEEILNELAKTTVIMGDYYDGVKKIHKISNEVYLKVDESAAEYLN